MTQLGASLLRTLPMPGGSRVRLAERLSRRDDPYGTVESLRAVIRMRDGFRMALDLAASAERIMYYSGVYDPWLTHAFKRILRPGDTVIDAGANIGFFSLLAAKCVGMSGSVHAFEPIPATYARLSENIRLNEYANITANCIALAAQAGELEFQVPQEPDTHLSLDRLASVVHTGSGQLVTVQACALDEYVTRAGIRAIRFAKFDIEGGEVAAVQGMRQALTTRQISYLMCEVNVPLLVQQGLPPSALRDAFASYGYEAYFFEHLGGRRRPVHGNLKPVSQMREPDIFGEYLFVAPDVALPQL